MTTKPKSIDFFDVLAIAGLDHSAWPQWIRDWADGGPGRWTALNKIRLATEPGHPVPVELMDKIVQSVNKWLQKP